MPTQVAGRRVGAFGRRAWTTHARGGGRDANARQQPRPLLLPVARQAPSTPSPAAPRQRLVPTESRCLPGALTSARAGRRTAERNRAAASARPPAQSPVPGSGWWWQLGAGASATREPDSGSRIALAREKEEGCAWHFLDCLFALAPVVCAGGGGRDEWAGGHPAVLLRAGAPSCAPAAFPCRPAATSKADHHHHHHPWLGWRPDRSITRSTRLVMRQEPPIIGGQRTLGRRTPGCLPNFLKLPPITRLDSP